MRAHSLSLALVSLALAGCDDGGSTAQTGGEHQVAMPVDDAPILTSETALPPEPVRAVPKATEVMIVDSGGRTPRRIGEGGLLPLARIIEIALQRVPGEIIEVELDDDDYEPEYELDILTADGRSIEMKISARRGIILDIEED